MTALIEKPELEMDPSHQRLRRWLLPTAVEKARTLLMRSNQEEKEAAAAAATTTTAAAVHRRYSCQQSCRCAFVH